MITHLLAVVFFFSSRRRHTRSTRDWSSDVCSSDLRCCRRVTAGVLIAAENQRARHASAIMSCHGGLRSPTTLRSEEHTSELQSRVDLVCRLLLEKKKKTETTRKRQRRTKPSTEGMR